MEMKILLLVPYRSRKRSYHGKTARTEPATSPHPRVTLTNSSGDRTRDLKRAKLRKLDYRAHSVSLYSLVAFL